MLIIRQVSLLYKEIFDSARRGNYFSIGDEQEYFEVRAGRKVSAFQKLLNSYQLLALIKRCYKYAKMHRRLS
jgi:hypothetical protein